MGADGRAAPARSRPPSLSICNICTKGSYLSDMQRKRESLNLDEIDWQTLLGIARELGCKYQGQPSWRRLIDAIASGNLTVVDRPNKRLRAFQDKLRKPMREEQRKQQMADWAARSERDRLRQERKRRAAGIPPRGAQEALEKATGYRDEFGRVNDSE